MANFGVALHSEGNLAIPPLRNAALSDRSLGRLDMPRRPRHPILTECSANDRFFSMHGEALYLNFSVNIIIGSIVFFN